MQLRLQADTSRAEVIHSTLYVFDVTLNAPDNPGTNTFTTNDFFKIENLPGITSGSLSSAPPTSPASPPFDVAWAPTIDDHNTPPPDTSDITWTFLGTHVYSASTPGGPATQFLGEFQVSYRRMTFRRARCPSPAAQVYIHIFNRWKNWIRNEYVSDHRLERARTILSCDAHHQFCGIVIDFAPKAAAPSPRPRIPLIGRMPKSYKSSSKTSPRYHCLLRGLVYFEEQMKLSRATGRVATRAAWLGRDVGLRTSEKLRVIHLGGFQATPTWEIAATLLRITGEPNSSAWRICRQQNMSGIPIKAGY